MFSESLFDLVTMTVVADLFKLPTIWAIVVAVNAALGVGFLRDAVAGASDVALTDFNDSLPCGVCQRIMTNIPSRLAALAPAELRHADPGAVHPSAGGLGKLRKALPGGSQPHSPAPQNPDACPCRKFVQIILEKFKKRR